MSLDLVDPLHDERSRLLEKAIILAMVAHERHSIRPSKRWRKSLPGTPYFVHPVWCATMFVQEPSIEEELRFHGACALALHDVLEDTHISLPRDFPLEVRNLVEEMTVPKSPNRPTTQIEIDHLASKSEAVILLKLFDKTANALDGPQSWMEGRWPLHRALLASLVDLNTPRYPDLIVLRIAIDILNRNP